MSHDIMQLVRSLRATTGISIKECHKAILHATQNTPATSSAEILSAAQDYLRKTGARFLQDSARTTDAGLVSVSVTGQHGAVVQFVCETDFVARSGEITEFVSRLPCIALATKANTVADLLTSEYSAGITVENYLNDLAVKFKENIRVKELKTMTCTQGTLGYYTHNQCKHDNVGTELALVSIDSATALDKHGEEICKNIAMHIVGAYTKPICVSLDQVPEEVKIKEQEIAAANTKNIPEDRRARAIEGSVNKQLKSLCLMSQDYIKDDSMTVSQYLNGIKVTEFIHLHTS